MTIGFFTRTLFWGITQKGATMTGIRKDVASFGPGWSNELIWYARAIRDMDMRPITNRTSFKYLAAIHGFTESGWVGSGVIPSGTPLPPATEQATVWQQCQHGGWYFLPWHRGYIAAYEAIVHETIIQLGGPTDWALPYWNYLNSADPNARSMPSAFTMATMPDGTPNPLARPPRRSTNVNRPLSLQAMSDKIFTGTRFAGAFGGGQTGFEHFAGQTGGVEQDPHNLVHVYIGGFMGDPDYAGLDPIFWLHHCNIDRLWEAWMSDPTKTQENGPAWSNGPSPRIFQMPDPNGILQGFTPGQTLPGGILAPTYDNLTIGTGIGGGAGLAAVGGANVPATFKTINVKPAKLIGASGDSISLTAGTTLSSVTMDSANAELAAANANSRIYLNLENIRGSAPSALLKVHLGLEGNSDIKEETKSVALFGLKKATDETSDHGGNGISITLDVTDILKALNQTAGEVESAYKVYIDLPEDEGYGDDITIERISLYEHDQS